jgi:hypothetical protein
VTSEEILGDKPEKLSPKGRQGNKGKPYVPPTFKSLTLEEWKKLLAQSYDANDPQTRAMLKRIEGLRRKGK